MNAGSIHAVQTIFLLLLIMVTAFALAARRLRIPYPIVLVLAGLLVSFLPRMPRIPLNPDVIFLIFLPPLLYAAAWQTSWREFRFNLVSIAMLAIGLVAFTVWGMAWFADHFIGELTWKAGLVLGAVLSTTDSIAAAAIAKQVGLPKSISDMLEGESLVNDATGLLALEFGLQILDVGRNPTVVEGLGRLMWLIGAGVGVGLLIAVVMTWVEQRIGDDGPIEIAISIVIPYTAYLGAEALHASGVLSVVACGLYLSRKSVSFFSPEVRLQVWSTWEALNFILNGIVFAMIGLQLPYVLGGLHGYSMRTLLLYGAGSSAALIALRILWMYPAGAVAYQIRTKLQKQKYEQPDAKVTFVMGWSGMRGVIALAAAFSLPSALPSGQPFAERNLIVFITFCVILVTLVLQGLTLPPLVHALGLAGKGGGDEEEESLARRTVLESAIAYLQACPGAGSGDLGEGFDDLLHHYRERLNALSGEDRELRGRARGALEKVRGLAKGALRAERESLIHLRDEGRIGDEVLRKLERELDLAESRRRSKEV